MRSFILALACLSAACTTDNDDNVETDTSGDTDVPVETDETDTDSDTDTAVETGEPMPAPLDLIGDWIDDWGTDIVITETEWVTPWYTHAILSHDNDAQILLAVSEDDVYQRYDWTMVDGSFWFCNVVYDGTSEEDALGRPAAGRTAYDVDGCNGFPFSQLIEAIDIHGVYTVTSGETITITKTDFSIDADGDVDAGPIAFYDNGAMYGVVDYSGDTDVDSAHIRYDWARLNSDLYACQVNTEGLTLEAAKALSRPDDSDVTTGGCHDEPWMLLTPAN